MDSHDETEQDCWPARSRFRPFLILRLAADAQPKPPLGLPPLSWPEDNPYSPAKAELGRLLYFDKRLSADETVSLRVVPRSAVRASPTARRSRPASNRRRANRSAPTVINRAYTLAQFWDGRAATLEEQAKGPMANPIEMGNTHEALVGQSAEDCRATGRCSRRRSAPTRSPSTASPRRSPCFERTVLSRQLALRPLQARRQEGDDRRRRFAAWRCSSTRPSATSATRAPTSR